MKLRTIAAIGVTVVYVIFFYLLSMSRLDDFQSLRLNELGDYLAGIFGPLALFWVVVGYFQQGEELRNNANELAASVEELKRQADTNQKRFESEIKLRDEERGRYKKRIQPHFKITKKEFFDDGGDRVATMELTNSGAPVRNVVVVVEEGGNKQEVRKYDLFRTDEPQEIKCSWRRLSGFQEIEPVNFEITYQDADHDTQVFVQKFQVMSGGLTRPRTLEPNNLHD